MPSIKQDHPLYGLPNAEKLEREREEITKRYEIRADGRVYDKSREKWLEPRTDRDGYSMYRLKLFGKWTLKGRHRLIALFFIDNPDPGIRTMVNHINETPGDDRIENLEWCDAKYNVNYGSGKTRRGIAQGKPVLMLDKITGEILNVFHHRCEAARTLGIVTDIQGAAIKLCCQGKRKSAYGYRWEFA